MNHAIAQNALLAAPRKAPPPSQQLIADVARKHGVSPFSQFFDLMRVRRKTQGVDFDEYYNNRIYLPEHSAEQKAEFVGKKGSFRLNKHLSPLSLTKEARAFLRDKVFFTSMIAQFGFQTTETQAVVSLQRGYGDIPTLRSANEIEVFMTEKARYPVFVKPEEGSGSVGSALIQSIDTVTKDLVLFNGKRIPVVEFAEEILKNFSDGFIVQTAVQQHSALSEVAGQAVGTIRVVTVYQDEKPKILCTLWKVPSPSAMSDNYWQEGSMLAEINKTTGKLVRCVRGSGPSQEVIEAHPVSGKEFPDFQIPFWDQVIDVTTRCHMLWPRFGVFGWDIAITETGPVIIECNANPFHMLFQLATGKGIWNREFAQIFDNVNARAKTIAKDSWQKRRIARKEKR